MAFILGYEYFQTNASKSFQELLNDQYLSDVTLVTGDDRLIRAHKIILCSSSAFFRNILRKYPHQNPLIYLKDIKYRYLDWIIEFMYTGQCDIDERELVQFLSVGKELGVNGLLEEIVNNDANISREDNDSDVHTNEKVENISQQREALSGVRGRRYG